MSLEEKLEIFKEKGWKYDSETGDIFSNTGRLIKMKHKGYINCGITMRKLNIKFHVGGHQLAWYLYYNEVPNVIDHINMIRDDNRIVNLRNVTKQQNHFNNKGKGYRFHKRDKKWYASIKLDGKQIHLGTFLTEEDAQQAYLEAKKVYHVI